MRFNRRFNGKTIPRRMIWGALALAAGALLGCSGSAAEKGQTADPVRPVKAMVVRAETAGETRTFPGIVTAAKEAELAFRVSGPLVQYDVRRGQRVNKGDVLARIDSRDFKVRVTRLSAALSGARANLKAMKAGARAEDIAGLEAELKAADAGLNDARADFTRQKNLLADHAASRAQYDNTKAAMEAAVARKEVVVQNLNKARRGARKEDIEAAEAQVRSLTADLKAAENALADTTLTAPFSGYINRKHVENHETVAAGRPVVSLIDVSTVEVKTAVPEEMVVRRGSLAKVFTVLDAFPGRPIPATLKEIGRSTDAANQSYPMTVVLQVPEKLPVEPGMAASVHLTIQKTEAPSKGFFLPASAVFADSNGQSCVWRIDPQTMQVQKAPVTVAELRGDTFHVTTGLVDGDRVATAGARFLRQGQKISILGA